MPKFADLADRYLEWMAHLAPTTQDDRRALLRTASSKRPEGALRAYFGRMPVDEIRKPLLLEWWAAEVEGRSRGGCPWRRLSNRRSTSPAAPTN